MAVDEVHARRVFVAEAAETQPPFALREDGEELLNRPVGFALKGVAAADSIADAEAVCKFLDSLAQKEGNLFVRTYIRRLLEPMVMNVDFAPVLSSAHPRRPR